MCIGKKHVQTKIIYQTKILIACRESHTYHKLSSGIGIYTKQKLLHTQNGVCSSKNYSSYIPVT